jgi:hypothetical protein
MPSVPRLFPGSTVVCLGSGPSLTVEDVEYCRGKAPVIAVNDTYRLAPWADVLYACDKKWWEHHAGVPEFAGLKFALQHPAAHWPGVTVLRNAGSHGIETHPSGVTTGGNSGYQAVNVAVHLGAKRIVLVGYDMQLRADGLRHWFGEHPGALRADSPYAQFIRAYATMVEPLRALGVTVINASRETALTCFPRQPLREALA